MNVTERRCNFLQILKALSYSTLGYGGGVDLWQGGGGGDRVYDSDAYSDEENDDDDDDAFARFGYSGGYGAQKQMLPSSMQDGVVEVVGVSSSFQLGIAQAGLARPTRLCQGRSVKIVTTRPFPLQIDGEPLHRTAYDAVDKPPKPGFYASALLRLGSSGGHDMPRVGVQKRYHQCHPAQRAHERNITTVAHRLRARHEHVNI